MEDKEYFKLRLMKEAKYQSDGLMLLLEMSKVGKLENRALYRVLTHFVASRFNLLVTFETYITQENGVNIGVSFSDISHEEVLKYSKLYDDLTLNFRRDIYKDTCVIANNTVSLNCRSYSISYSHDFEFRIYSSAEIIEINFNFKDMRFNHPYEDLSKSITAFQQRQRGVEYYIDAFISERSRDFLDYLERYNESDEIKKDMIKTFRRKMFNDESNKAKLPGSVSADILTTLMNSYIDVSSRHPIKDIRGTI